MNQKMRKIVINYLNSVDMDFIKYSCGDSVVEFWDQNGITKTETQTDNIIDTIIQRKSLEGKKQVIADYILNNGFSSLQDHTINDIYQEIKVDAYIQEKKL